MGIDVLLGVILSIIGLPGIIYVFVVFFKFKGAIKKAYGFIAFGILSGYFVLLTIVYEDFGKLPLIDGKILVKILLGITTILIGIGSMKMSKILDYIPETFLKTIGKYK